MFLSLLLISIIFYFNLILSLSNLFLEALAMHLSLQRCGTWPKNLKTTMCTQRLLAVSAAVLAVRTQQSLAVPAASRAVSTRRSLAVPVLVLVLPALSTAAIPHCHKVTTEPSRQIEGIQSFKFFFARCLNESRISLSAIVLWA
jgi:hypothetical protein